MSSVLRSVRKRKNGRTLGAVACHGWNRDSGSWSERRDGGLACRPIAWLNMRHRARPSTMPAWTPKPTIRRGH